MRRQELYCTSDMVLHQRLMREIHIRNKELVSDVALREDGTPFGLDEAVSEVTDNHEYH